MIVMKKIVLFVLLSCIVFAVKAQPKYYIFFSAEREKIHDSTFVHHQGIEGAQVTYSWKMLEPTKGQYDFSAIEADLQFLKAHGKKLWVQLQDVTFMAKYYACPNYLRNDPEYHGGTNAQYEIINGKPVNGGNVTRRWDPAVAKRFHLLIQELAKRFDDRIAGINLPETAVDFPDTLGLKPQGYTPTVYLKAIKENMHMLRQAFKKSVPLQYANFMPGDGQVALAEVYRYGREIGIGLGGPDVKVYRKFQMLNSYPLIRESNGIVPTGVAVQDGNYSVINDKTGKKVTVPEILAFGTDYLKLSYMFWCTEEPYYSKEVLPLLQPKR